MNRFEPNWFSYVSLRKFYPMKTLFLSLVLFSYSFFSAQIAPRKVQLVILFDTSNSMDGLLNQAKAKIWAIVNEVSSLRYQGTIPQLEIAMYDYGNQSLNIKDNYVRQQLNFTKDLDLVSEKLFGLTTNGGDEFCGAVIQKSLSDLSWSANNGDLKLIYIAGNEPFNQGPISYKEACALAKTKGVLVSTIFCGPYDEGVRTFWQDGATCSGGDFFNINSDQALSYMATPYDSLIQSNNLKLNGTYVSYGVDGVDKKNKQVRQDENAKTLNNAVMVERAVAKGSTNYWNGAWDLIDAAAADSTFISKLEEKDKTDELKGKTAEEIKTIVAEKTKEREQIQQEIATLNVKRVAYIEAESKKNQVKTDDFGTAVAKSLRKNAVLLGFDNATEK
ncbi:MAG: VWA domain-containing protein [Flavobacteriia bacterium]|nr:VWA domain-containing protein [Flavobacteriia bacterium]